MKDKEKVLKEIFDNDPYNLLDISNDDNNKLIAGFMGVITKEKNWYNGQELKKAGFPFSPGLMGNGTDDLKCHSSWDWLIPVIKKIHKTIGVKLIDNCTTEEWNIYKTIDNLSFYQDIDSIYFYVVEFINWYNKNKL